MMPGQKRYTLQKAAKMISDPKHKAMQLELIALRWYALHGDQKALRELREKIVR